MGINAEVAKTIYSDQMSLREHRVSLVWVRTPFQLCSYTLVPTSSTDFEEVEDVMVTQGANLDVLAVNG